MDVHPLVVLSRGSGEEEPGRTEAAILPYEEVLLRHMRLYRTRRT
jgi:hypothetical protein